LTFPPTVDPLLRLPKIVVLARAWMLSAMAPTPIVTRLPNPDNAADTVNGTLRLEEGGGTRANRFHYDMQVLLHGYSPDEDQAESIANDATMLMAAARGQTIQGWYIVDVPAAGVAMKRTDPDVILPRYLSTVTWRVAGQPWTP
jgi:hypothetical protein